MARRYLVVMTAAFSCLTLGLQAHGQPLAAKPAKPTETTVSPLTGKAAAAPVAADPWLRALFELFSMNEMSPITRGPLRQREVAWGDLWSLDISSRAVQQLTRDQVLRSPLVTPAGTFALSKDGLRVYAPGYASARTINLPVDPATISQLLVYKDAKLFALRGSCLVSFAADASGWSEKLCGFTEAQIHELVLRSRTCAQKLIDERFEGDPLITRVDVMLRASGSHISTNLTGGRTARFNTDPHFLPDCAHVIFVARAEPVSKQEK